MKNIPTTIKLKDDEFFMNGNVCKFKDYQTLDEGYMPLPLYENDGYTHEWHNIKDKARNKNLGWERADPNDYGGWWRHNASEDNIIRNDSVLEKIKKA